MTNNTGDAWLLSWDEEFLLVSREDPLGNNTTWERWLHLPIHTERSGPDGIVSVVDVEYDVRGNPTHVTEHDVDLGGRDPVTGKNRPPRLELMRLTLPRRTYTYNHMNVVVEALANVHARRDGIAGLEFDYEPPLLRHFTATFRPLTLTKAE